MSALVVRALFRRLICTKFGFLRLLLYVSFLAFDCICHLLHEIDLDVHGTDLQVVPFIILAMSVSCVGFQGFCLHSVSGNVMKTTIDVTQRSGCICSSPLAS